MIVVTGVAGFIGSCLVAKLNKEGHKDIILVDDFSNTEKNKNLTGLIYADKVNRNDFFQWLKINHASVNFIFHIGARTDTTESDILIFDELNLNYTKQVWAACVAYDIPLVYASSAATYGLGEYGYEDNHEVVTQLKPLNPYGVSKNEFDKWALQQAQQPRFWAGLKFFNVYGPNEYHKGRMASVIFHAYNQIQQNGVVKLFRSHRPEFKDGEQLRDFIYVKDLTEVCLFLMQQQPPSGLYNLGSGKARTFIDLVTNTFKALNKLPNIVFVDTPIDIRNNYQYFTEANMAKLKSAGYTKAFNSLEEGVADYVGNYLATDSKFRYYTS